MLGNLGTGQPPAEGKRLSPGQCQVYLDKDAAAVLWGLLPSVPTAQVSGKGCSLKHFPSYPEGPGPEPFPEPEASPAEWTV